jgi:UDP-N-acetylglucosamine--N-acetylmuramyl-(pentapeptide) pyrophosphoryl-undecaprenol N-acetylglucosamine transferase
LLARFVAKQVLEAFPHSFTDSTRAICTGNPLRKSFMTQVEKPTFQFQIGSTFKILVLGGSQGAKILNESLPEALSGFDNIEIKHQTGQVMQNEVTERYKYFNKSAEVAAFFNDMAGAYQWADLIICRAGAMTVSEVCACGLPTIFVPLLNAIDDHQTANARYLSEAGAALLIPQTELNPENLSKAVNMVLSNLPAMKIAAKKLARLDATYHVTEICVAEAML